MKNLNNVSFSVYTSLETRKGVTVFRDMIALSAKIRDYLPSNASDEERAEDEKKGPHYISFYMLREEFEGIVTGNSFAGSMNDGNHNIRVMGEVWTYYNMEFQRANAGVMKVPYVNLSFPYFCQKTILRAARLIWDAKHVLHLALTDKSTMDARDAANERVSIHLTQPILARWDRLYGQGKGKVALDCDDRTRSSLDAALKEDESLSDNYERLLAIAKNTTYSFCDVGTLYLSVCSDGREYSFSTAGMHGAIVDHGKDGKHDWSIHT